MSQTNTILIDELSDAEVVALAYDWPTWRRPEQAPPAGDWLIWLILTGRGWGKTRTGAETIREWVNSRSCRILHLVARTAADARDTMVEGESGILAVCAGDIYNRPEYIPSKRLIEWPNGAHALLFAAEKPDALRGPQCDGWWADELASWKYLQDTWDNLQFGARLGERVRGIITTTPRPIKLIKKLLTETDVFTTRGNTYDNAPNLAPSFIGRIRERYQGTRLGRQELNGEVLDDNPRALWRRDNIETQRLIKAPPLITIVVSVDPPASSNPDSDEAGIIAVGRDMRDPAHYYILDDLSVSMATPEKWGRAAVTGYYRHSANKIVAEVNNGGEMVEATIKTIDPHIAIHSVHATHGKYTRAEPVSALSEQGRLHFVGSFPELEDQCCEWEPGVTESPDRMDAMVWGITEIMSMGSTGKAHPDRKRSFI
jgi:phage terminase large subunit-like protein